MSSYFTWPWSWAGKEPELVHATKHEDPKIPGQFPDEIYEVAGPESEHIYELQGTMTESVDPLLPVLSKPFDAELPLTAYTDIQAEPGHMSSPRSQDTDDKTSSDGAEPNKTEAPASARVDTPKNFKRSKPKPKSHVASHASSHISSKKPSSSPASSNNLIIAFFGMTGTGKSSFINKLANVDVKVGHGLQSMTTEIEEVQCKIGDYNVTLVDTPGFDDTTRSDTEILTLIASWLKDAYHDNARLTGVVYLHRISDNRMTGSSYRNLSLFRSLCGMRSLSHVILATTMWDKVTDDEGALRENDLLGKGKFWGDMKEAGASVRRYNNTKAGASALVNELLQMGPIVLKIQHEMAVEKKSLIDTAAGKSINARLEEMAAGHKEELDMVKKDFEKALMEKDAKWLDEIEKSRNQLEEKIAENKRNMDMLRRPINTKPWYRRSYKCKGCGERVVKVQGQKQTGSCPWCHTFQIFV